MKAAFEIKAIKNAVRRFVVANKAISEPKTMCLCFGDFNYNVGASAALSDMIPRFLRVTRPLNMQSPYY